MKRMNAIPLLRDYIKFLLEKVLHNIITFQTYQVICAEKSNFRTGGGKSFPKFIDPYLLYQLEVWNAR